MSSGPPTGGGGGASLSCEEAEATWRDVYVTWDCLNELNMHMYDCVQCTCQHANSHKGQQKCSGGISFKCIDIFKSFSSKNASKIQSVR